MTKYFAFLRAVNVGKRRIKMDKLKSTFEALGFENVRTFIASGNVIFESGESAESLKNKIETQLEQVFGFEIVIFLRTESELNDIIQSNPFEVEDSSKKIIYISFLNKEPDSETRAKLSEIQNDYYSFRVIDKELFTLRILHEESDIFSNNLIEKILKVPATTRNLNTLERIIKR